MNLSITANSPNGKIRAIASKSMAHRLLICAAFTDSKTVIRCEQTNDDINATVACLSALGASITRNAPYFTVEPINKHEINKNATLECKESGSTLRFLLPVVAALGAESKFELEGRLPDRPLTPLSDELLSHGVKIIGKNPLYTEGILQGAEFSIDGNVSSQFISGLLFALSLLDHDSTLTVTKSIESSAYIDMTCDALALFGAPVCREGNVFKISPRGTLHSPKTIEVEGDWSNAAFPLALGILGGDIELLGLNPESSQGDMAIIELLGAFGGNISYDSTSGAYRATKSALCGIDIDASQIPDLVPILATVASVAKGKTTIRGASRLRLKESDRLGSTCAVLSALGATIKESDDGLVIEGVDSLSPASVDSFNDHRIAMSVAVASSVCTGEIKLSRAESVRKSYPAFFDDMRALGMTCTEI